jgi:hypothetical protein
MRHPERKRRIAGPSGLAGRVAGGGAARRRLRAGTDAGRAMASGDIELHDRRSGSTAEVPGSAVGRPRWYAQKMRRLSLFLGLFVFAVGCDDAAGCDDVLTDLDTPMSQSAYFDEAAVARVTPQGVAFIEQSLSPIIQSFVSADCSEVWCPDGWGTCDGANTCKGNDPDAAFVGIAIPATTFPADFPLFGSYDQRICMPSENPTFEDCNAYVRLDDLVINPNSTTADLSLSADITAWSSKIHLYVDNPGPNVGTCDVYLRQAASPSNPVYKTITAEVFLDNSNPLGRLAVRPENVTLSVNEDDVFIDGCLLEYDFIKDFVFGFIEDTIKEQIADVVDSTLTGLLSEGCLDAPCSRTDLSFCGADDICRLNSDSSPVPALLGLEGNVALDALLGGFSGRADRVAFSAFANQGSTPSGGLTLELKAAAQASSSDCVPNFPAPSSPMPSFSPSGTDYHAAIGASDLLLNTVIHEAFSSGALCQSISGNDIGALNSGAVSLIVPSLGQLTGGSNVPLTIDVLPRTPPEVQIGANITGVDEDGATVLIEPLLTLVLNDLDLDIYAERQGALFRVLTLRADLALDLSLAEGPSGDLQLVAGDASRWLQDVEVLNAEVIAESATDIEEAIPVLLGVVLPLLTDSLDQSFPIPTFSGFGLDLDRITGSQTYGTTAYDKTRYAYLAVYSDLVFDPNAAHTVARVQTMASLADVVMPDLDGLRAGEKVKVTIDGDFAQRQPDAEVVLWSRVDGGFWRPVHEGRELVIKDPVLHIEGEHVIEVAAARKGVPASQDLTPVELELITDFVPPTVELIDEGGAVRVRVTDTVAYPEELVVSYALDGMDRGHLVLDAHGEAVVTVDTAQHQLSVTATDLVGRQTSKLIGQLPVFQEAFEPVAEVAAPTAEPRADVPESSVASSGCSQTSDAGLASLLGLLGLVASRRRRR